MRFFGGMPPKKRINDSPSPDFGEGPGVGFFSPLPLAQLPDLRARLAIFNAHLAENGHGFL